MVSWSKCRRNIKCDSLIQYYEKKSINQILITSSTLSSAKVIKKFKFNKTVHQFYPVDHFLFTNKFYNIGNQV